MSAGFGARVLPHDLEAERAVLGSVLGWPDGVFDVAEQVQVEDFYRDAHRRIFRQILTLTADKVAVDALTVREALERAGELDDIGGPAYLYGLTDGVPRSTNAVEYARIVREKATLRLLVMAGQKLMAEAYEADQPAADVLDRAHAALFTVADRRKSIALVDGKRLMATVLETVEKLVADKRRVTGVATGFSELDDLTRGLQPGDLVIVAARPSMGKTAFGMNVAQHGIVKDGRRVLVFSLEMGTKPLGLRLLASEARVDHHRLLSGRILDEDWVRLSNAMNRLAGNGGLYIDDSAAVTVFDVRARARRLKADGGLDLIIIDYLQLMTGAQKAENKNLEVAAITKGLKAIARDLDVPLMLLSQLSREPDKRGNHRPQLSDMRDSGAIEQDADVVIALHREEKYTATADNRGLAEAILLKQRNGPTGTVRLLFHDHLVRFDNVQRGAERPPYAEAPV